MTMASCGKLAVLNQLFNSLDDAFKQHLVENSNALFRLLNIDSANMFVKFMKSVFVDEFYDPQKHVFTFGEHSMGVTLEDVLFLTGLPIIGKPVVLSNSNDGSAFLRVFGERFKGKMSLSFPEALEIATNVDEEINRRKIAVLLIICSAFISPNNDKHSIPSSYVQFLENVDDVDTYAWGAALLSYLYRGAKSYMTKKKARGNLWIVLAFFLIRLPKLQKLMGVDLSDHSEAVRDGAPWLPWIVQQIKKKSHNHYLNYKIDLILPLDDEDIKWTPYANMVCPRDQDHLNAARDITPLFCYNYVEHHMPHNCSQQFPVFKSYNLGSMSWNYYEIKFKHRKGRHVQNFLEFYKNEINAYNNRKPAELYMTATESEGSFEHDGVDHGTEHNSEHNEDLSGHHDFFVHENERERLVHDASKEQTQYSNEMHSVGKLKEQRVIAKKHQHVNNEEKGKHEPVNYIQEDGSIAQTLSTVDIIELSDDDDSEKDPCDSSLWYYADFNQNIQGPFSMRMLKMWKDVGYFPSDFKVWKRGQSPLLLNDVVSEVFLK